MKNIFLELFAAGALCVPLLSCAAEPSGPQHVTSNDTSFAEIVRTDGETIVIGAPGFNNLDNDAGTAFVYTQDGDEWVQAAELVAGDGEVGERFGTNAAVDGEVIVVTAPFASVEGLLEAGAAYVYERTDAGWRETARLVADEPSTMAKFGESVAIDGDRILVGAPLADAEFGETEGAAYFFERDADGQWQQTAKLNRADEVRFGGAVAISGDTAVVTGNSGYGVAHVYEFRDNAWQLAQSLAPAGHGSNIDVRLENDVLVVGAPNDVLPEGPPWVGVGRVHVFERNGEGWQQTATLQSPSPYQMDLFGMNIDFNDGVIAAANGYEHPDHLSLFLKNENGEWRRVHELEGYFPRIDQAMAVAANVLVTGGPGEGGGFVHIFDVTELLTGEGVADEEPEPVEGEDDNGSAAADEDIAADESEQDADTGNGAANERPGNDTAAGGEDGTSGGGALAWLLAACVLRLRVARRVERFNCL